MLDRLGQIVRALESLRMCSYGDPSLYRLRNVFDAVILVVLIDGLNLLRGTLLLARLRGRLAAVQ
jgi:hypothetical protein